MDREPPTNSDGLDDRGDRRATAHVVSVDPPLRTHTDFVDGKIQFSIRVDADVVLRVEFDGGAGAVCEILRPLVEDPVGYLFEFFLGHCSFLMSCIASNISS